VVPAWGICCPRSTGDSTTANSITASTSRGGGSLRGQVEEVSELEQRRSVIDHAANRDPVGLSDHRLEVVVRVRFGRFSRMNLMNSSRSSNVRSGRCWTNSGEGAPRASRNRAHRACRSIDGRERPNPYPTFRCDRQSVRLYGRLSRGERCDVTTGPPSLSLGTFVAMEGVIELFSHRDDRASRIVSVFVVCDSDDEAKAQGKKMLRKGRVITLWDGSVSPYSRLLRYSSRLLMISSSSNRRSFRSNRILGKRPDRCNIT